MAERVHENRRRPAPSPDRNSILAAVRRDPKKIDKSLVDALIVWNMPGSPYTFEQAYADYENPYSKEAKQKMASGAKYDKFDIACALIEDGRYGTQPGQDVTFLVDKFLSRRERPTTEDRILQDKLRVMLVQKGRVLEGSKQERAARESFARIVMTDDKLQQLCQVLPIGFMGALATIDYYKNIEDPEEKRRLRRFASKSLLRPYLGDIVYTKPHGDLSFREIFDLVPDEALSDKDDLTFNLATHYFQKQALRFFIGGADGIARLREEISQETSTVKKEFLAGILADFEVALKRPIPNQFKDYVVDEVESAIQGVEVRAPFPAAHQRLFMREFQTTKRKLLCGGTGSGKTACAYLGMESLGAEKVVIFGPANARDTWPEQAQKHFKEGQVPSVFTVEERSQLDDPRIKTAKYVYISSNLLSRAIYRPQQARAGMTDAERQALDERNRKAGQQASELFNKLKDLLVTQRGTDGVIIEEAQEFRHASAQCTKVVTELVKTIQGNYQPRNILVSEIPIVSLTATPVFSEIQDLDVHMAMLYPNTYGLPGQSNLPTFSSACDYQPEVAFIKLYGERLLMQFDTEDIYGEKVPTLKFDDIKRVSIEMTPEMRVLYEWVEQIPNVNALNRIWLLRGCLINPGVLKDLNQEHHWYQTARTRQELERELFRFKTLYDVWVANKNPRIATVDFSPDWIAYQPGGREFLLDCFFSPELVSGVESLTFNHRGLNMRFAAAPSPKAGYVRDRLTRAVTKQGEEYRTRTKFCIISSEQTLGITRFLDDDHLTEDDFGINAFSLYELAVGDWLPGVSREQVRNVDGSVSFRERRRIAQEFRSNPHAMYALILNREAMDTSIDMAPRAAMEGIDNVEVIFFASAYDWARMGQMGGRFLRPGLGKEVGFYLQECDGTIDQGLFNLMRRNHLLTQLVMAGVKLDPEDAQFYDSTRTARRIIEVSSSSQFFIRNAIRLLRGTGEEELVTALSKESAGASNFENWAKYYFAEGMDIFRTVGNNAELVKNVILNENPGEVLVVGAGTCVLDRKLKADGYEGKVVNLDINPAVLRLAKEEYPEIGEIVVGRASKLEFPDESFGAVDYSFMLDMTKLFDDRLLGTTADLANIERVKALAEMNRVLKMGGKAVLTFAEGVLDEESFIRFALALNHFGFKLSGENNGISYAIDQKPKRRLGWILTLEKTGSVNLEGLDPDDLFFLTDSTIGVSKYKGDTSKADPGTVIVQNPFFAAENFEIINPFSGNTIQTGKNHEDADLTIDTVTVDAAENGVVEAGQNGQVVAEVLNSNVIWDRIGGQIASSLARSDFDGAATGLAELKQQLGGATWDWWRHTVRRVEREIDRTSSTILANGGLDTYRRAELVTAMVFLEQRVHQTDFDMLAKEDEERQRFERRIRRSISNRFN